MIKTHKKKYTIKNTEMSLTEKNVTGKMRCPTENGKEITDYSSIERSISCVHSISASFLCNSRFSLSSFLLNSRSLCKEGSSCCRDVSLCLALPVADRFCPYCHTDILGVPAALGWYLAMEECKLP